MALKALTVSGSPRTGGNTQILLERVGDVLREGGVETEYIKIGGEALRGCTACCKCKETKDGFCVINNDLVNEVAAKMYEADIIVIGAPVYFGSMPAEMSALLDRIGYAARPNMLLSRKIGAPIAVARKAGQNFTFAQMLYWYLLNDMVVPGSKYWNVATAREKGEVVEDKEAIGVVEHLARNLLWLGEKLF